MATPKQGMVVARPKGRESEHPILDEVQVAQQLVSWIRELPFGTLGNLILDMVDVFLGGIEQGVMQDDALRQLNNEAARRRPARLARQAQVARSPNLMPIVPASSAREAMWNRFKHEFMPTIQQDVIIPNPFPNGVDGVAVWRSFRSYLYFRRHVSDSPNWVTTSMIDKRYDLRPEIRQLPVIITTGPEGWAPAPEQQLDESIWAVRTPSQWIIVEPQWTAWLKGQL